MRGVIYARYSTERQTEASIADQLRVCREYAARHSWAVAAEFTDEGISGAALGNRPGVQRALAESRQGDILLVNDLSRLARSQDLAPLVARLRHRGVRVIGVQDGFDSDSGTARMQAGLSGIMSEEFRAMIGARTHSAQKRLAEEGKSTGGKALSDPALVGEIFSRFAAGDTMKAIASDLNRRGIPSPGATWNKRGGARGRWLVSAIHAILHNERYAGRLVWNRYRMVKDPDTGRRVRRERPREEWVIRDIEPLVDSVTWQKVQARFGRHTGSRGGARRYLLSGVLECDLCGSKLIVIGGTQRRYVCGTYHGGGVHACTNDRSIPRAIAEEGILGPIRDNYLSPEGLRMGLEALRAARREAEREPHPAQGELAELERLVREGVLSRDVAQPSIDRARGRLAEARDLRWPSEALWQETMQELREVLNGEDIPASREALLDFIGTVRVRPAAEPGFVETRVAARRILMASGSRSGIWVGSGGTDWTRLPTSLRHSRKA